MVVMTAGKMPDRIVVAVVRLRAVMIVGMIQLERKIAQEHVLMGDRRARRMLDSVHGVRQRHPRKHEDERDAEHRGQPLYDGGFAGLHIESLTVRLFSGKPTRHEQSNLGFSNEAGALCFADCRCNSTTTVSSENSKPSAGSLPVVQGGLAYPHLIRASSPCAACFVRLVADTRPRASPIKV